MNKPLHCILKNQAKVLTITSCCLGYICHIYLLLITIFAHCKVENRFKWTY